MGAKGEDESACILWLWQQLKRAYREREEKGGVPGDRQEGEGRCYAGRMCPEHQSCRAALSFSHRGQRGSLLHCRALGLSGSLQHPVEKELRLPVSSQHYLKQTVCY